MSSSSPRMLLVVVLLAACGSKPADPPPPAPTPEPEREHKVKKPLPLGRTEEGAGNGSQITLDQKQLDAIGGAGSDDDNVLSAANGAMIVSGPPVAARTTSPWFLFDDDWASPYTQQGAKDLEPLVIALPDEVKLDRFKIDASRIYADRLPEHVKIDASMDGQAWTPVGDAPLMLPASDNVRVLAKPQMAARFLRITLVNNHTTATAGPNLMAQELEEVSAYGKRAGTVPVPSATGTYEIDGVGRVSLTQTGTRVTGCIDKKQTHIEGAFEGRVLRFALTEPAAADSGPVVMTFGADRAFYGFWPGGVASHALLSAYDGKRTSDKPGACPAVKGDPIANDLAATGRSRLYGVVFDRESDAIRDDAKPALDRLAAILKADKKLALVIEGHSDAVATAPHNTTLTGKQASAVKAYLVAAGIDAGRLAVRAMNSTESVAPDSTSLGRTHNRRIEIVKGTASK